MEILFVFCFFFFFVEGGRPETRKTYHKENKRIPHFLSIKKNFASIILDLQLWRRCEESRSWRSVSSATSPGPCASGLRIGWSNHCSDEEIDFEEDGSRASIPAWPQRKLSVTGVYFIWKKTKIYIYTHKHVGSHNGKLQTIIIRHTAPMRLRLNSDLRRSDRMKNWEERRALHHQQGTLILLYPHPSLHLTSTKPVWSSWIIQYNLCWGELSGDKTSHMILMMNWNKSTLALIIIDSYIYQFRHPYTL